MPPDTPLPLDGVHVIDFTQITLGPIATQMLGDFGADVIKIERPDQGDFLRTTLPLPEGDSLIYLAGNRNKRAITPQPADRPVAATHESPPQVRRRARA